MVKNSRKKAATTPVLVTEPMTTKSPKNNRFFLLILIVFLLGIASFMVAKKYRGMIVAGIVNTTPIPRWELDKLLVARYGKSTLDEMVSLVLLDQLATKNQITVSSSEIDTEIKSLEDNLGGKEALQASMAQYGIDDAKLRDEVKAIVTQKKLAAKMFTVEVTDKEIEEYYTTNKALYGTKTLNDVKEDIKTSLVEQKTQSQFSTWFQEERAKAKIQVFI